MIRNKLLHNFEDMRQVLRIAENGDTFYVTIDFHRELFLQAANRAGLNINVQVVRKPC